MKRASEFRSLAKSALTNNWGIAIAAGFIASMLGAGTSVSVPSFNFNLGGDSSAGNENIPSGTETVPPEVFAIIAGVLAFVGIFALVFGAVYFFLGSVVDVGYKRFNLDLIGGETPAIRTLFAYFKSWSSAVVTKLLVGIFTFLWSLLFIIPGIIASYSYAMTSYILAENPGLSARDAINESKRLMRGNKWRLFCLRFSFFGWMLLALLTCGLGFIVLSPYMAAAEAAFYNEIAHPEAEYSEIPDVEATVDH